MTSADQMSGETPELRALDRGVARKQAFLQAAREVFLEHGYEAASVNEVVRRAGGSLATLYSQYGSKEGLFLAVAAEHQERFLAQILPVGEDYEHLPLREGLAVFANRFLDAILHPRQHQFFSYFRRRRPQISSADSSPNEHRPACLGADELYEHA